MLHGSESAAGRDLCWNCQSQVGGEYFCESCVKIQPPSKEVDYFSILGLPRALGVDLKDLEQRYYERSRKLHPDYYQQRSEQEKAYSLENSAMLNKAYRTLRDPIKRVEYLLQVEEGRVAAISTKPPADLFEEILRIQETLEDYKDQQTAKKDQELETLREMLKTDHGRLAARKEGLEKELLVLFEKWDQYEPLGSSEKKKDMLGRFREILANRAYLLTVLRDLEEKLG